MLAAYGQDVVVARRGCAAGRAGRSDREREKEDFDGEREHAEAVEPERLPGEAGPDVGRGGAQEVDDDAGVGRQGDAGESDSRDEPDHGR